SVVWMEVRGRRDVVISGRIMGSSPRSCDPEIIVPPRTSAARRASDGKPCAKWNGCTMLQIWRINGHCGILRTGRRLQRRRNRYGQYMQRLRREKNVTGPACARPAKFFHDGGDSPAPPCAIPSERNTDDFDESVPVNSIRSAACDAKETSTTLRISCG